MLTALKTAAGLAALLLVVLALLAVIGGLVGFARRAVKGPGARPSGLAEPPSDEESGR